MLKKFPKILSHVSAVKESNFTTSEYILHKDGSSVKLLNRFCPHRMYPLSQPGDKTNNIVCKFHGFEWSASGEPVNNNKKIQCGEATVLSSGLVAQNFHETDNTWSQDIANEKNLEYSHTLTGSSKGSWLWMMEIQVDLLHIRKGHDVIHPDLADVTDLDEVKMEEGDGWVLQTSSTGWWMFLYPFTFIEWNKGCLAINTVTPDNVESEFGFQWTTQFYYDPTTPIEKRKDFESLEDVFKEDVQAIEAQRGKWFPIKKPYNRLEDHCVHFGKWISENRT